MAAAAPRIHNGTYSISFPRGGSHRTLKVHTVKDGNLAGKRIISLLAGPDNTSDYVGFGFVDDDHVTVWRKCRSAVMTAQCADFYGDEWNDDWSRWQKAAAVFTDLTLRERGYWTSEGCELLLEGRCVVCNRKLTVPESIKTGIGPVCASKGT